MAQITIYGVALLSSALTTGMNWAVTRFLDAPESQAAISSSMENRLAAEEGRVDLLCNDYMSTVSRIDQNMQAFAKAVKANVVVGRVNPDICKIRK